MKEHRESLRLLIWLVLVVSLLVGVWPGLVSVRGQAGEPQNPEMSEFLSPEAEAAFRSAVVLHVSEKATGESLTYLRPGATSPGIYAARDYYHLSPSVYPLVGGHRTFYWNELEPNEGDFAWYKIHDFINQQAAEGKKAAFGISTYNGLFGGISVPGWFISAYPFAVVTCTGGHQIPKYWHDRYLEKYGNFVAALGREFNGNANLSWIQIGTGLYGENQPSPDYFDSCLQSAGLDSIIWVNTATAITTLYTNAFRTTPALFQFAPRYLADWERPTSADHAATTGAGLMHDGLVPDRDKAFGSNNACNNGAGHWDPIVKYSSSVPIAFESYQFYLPTVADVYWGILNGLAKHADYLNLDKCLLNVCDASENVVLPLQPRTDVFPLYQFANRYLGKTVQNTPSVWAALRETEYTFCPDAGNFAFWLYQDNEANGGRTVAEWNVSAYPEGRYARRTDQATGNRYMYFDVDDSYINGGMNQVVVTIRYYDSGADRWQLHYQAQSDAYKLAGEVQKTNSGSWLTATFTLDDAKFANGQIAGNDFRVDCMNDGNEWIHLVDVRKSSPTLTAYLDLVSGPNLVSVPLAPQNGALPDVLSSIGGSYTKVFSFVDNEWKRYIVGAPPAFNNLTSLNEKIGFWIYMSAPATLSIQGAAPGTVIIPLQAGVNMVGYPGATAKPVVEALSSISGKYTKIFAFINGEWKRYIVGAPPAFNNLTQMEPKIGYWIYTTEACNWVIGN